MTTESPLEKTFLAETLQREYGLSVELVEPLPTGWMAYCYRVTCTGCERYFLKLQGVDWTASFTHDPDFYLPVTHALHAQGILPHIVYPIPASDGRLMLNLDGFHWVLSNYISGQTIGFGKITRDLLPRVAGLVGILHRSLPLLSLPNPLREQYALAFEPTLLRSFDILQDLTPADRQGKHALRDLLLPRKDKVLSLLRRLKEFQVQAMAANKAQVLCHADLHGGNLLLDDQDNLYILDWEGAHIAPQERDLFFFAGEEDFWEIFLPAYEREFGPARLDSAVLGFYFYHRTLEDLTDWVARILYHNTDDAQDAKDLGGIIEYSLPDLPRLEDRVAQITARIAKR